MVLSDGRYVMSHDEIKKRIWEKVKGWTLDPTDGRYLIFNFPLCVYRELKQRCLPCGRMSSYDYNCTLKNSLISMAYCNNCTERVEPDETK